MHMSFQRMRPTKYTHFLHSRDFPISFRRYFVNNFGTPCTTDSDVIDTHDPIGDREPELSFVSAQKSLFANNRISYEVLSLLIVYRDIGGCEQQQLLFFF